MEVIGRLYTQTALHRWQDFPVFSEQEYGLHCRPVPLERENLLPLLRNRTTVLRPCIPSLVTKLTELSRDRQLDSEQLAFVEQVLEKKISEK